VRKAEEKEKRDKEAEEARLKRAEEAKKIVIKADPSLPAALRSVDRPPHLLPHYFV
jgi:predicted Rossmann fold nucleotide-binding protein DprA/Smf involved in DNA uptake